MVLEDMKCSETSTQGKLMMEVIQLATLIRKYANAFNDDGCLATFSLPTTASCNTMSADKDLEE